MGTATMLVRPRSRRLLRLRVLRAEQVTPHFRRITLGGEALGHFSAAGWGQRIRVVLPPAGTDLEPMPERLDLLGYARFLAAHRGRRPLLRDYTVRDHRALGVNGPELDIDIVAAGHEGPGAAWARACAPGDHLGVVDAGPAFDASRGIDHVLLVADETGVPTVAGVLASLPATSTGTAVLEVPTIDDALDLPHPPGVDLVWLSRDVDDAPGSVALDVARSVTFDGSRLHAFVAGERALVAELRRHLQASGVPRVRISSGGYWRRR